ncbi:MAG: aspartate dehydrogenase [Paraburkholderia tropica]|uniref:L-aspartate dehydrogenase n=1 Tax=Paraburkholderia tropica TaxID=92647 RepID=A0ABX5MM01_9BURK|nr:aspartate dehydrogenase [Paraburkholderia tropica]PXX12552.1 aspartate dehydrogenase [Paraburkholderia tropica]PZW76529.1 aspartate dehydrogenase [Paraburkholderia tropica]
MISTTDEITEEPDGRLRVAIAGLGAVGLKVAEALDSGLPGLKLVAVSAKDRAAAAQRLAQCRHAVPVVSVSDLEPLADIVVECAPSSIFREIAEPFLRAGKTVIALSAGALLANEQLVELAREFGGKLIVPTGALLGLDAVSAAAEGKIHSVHMVTRKPVKGLVGAPYLTENKIGISDITEPLRVFKGSPRDAATGFPANLNVAVALGLAGIGVDDTVLEIWADPNLERNTHTIEVVSDSATFRMSIENIPTDNPKTGRITAQSVISCLRKLTTHLRVGS